MYKIARSALGALLAVLYGCGSVCAATVSASTGAALINEGKGFVPLNGHADLSPGARLMVRPGQVATITYSDSCSVKVGSGQVWVIQPGVPCPSGAREVDLTGRMNDGMGPPPAPEEPAEGISPGKGLLIAGGIVGGGLLIACIVDWCKHKHSGSSP